MQDSATAAQRPASSPATWSSMLEPSNENNERSWRSAIRSRTASQAGWAAGSQRVTTSTSARRRHVVISSPANPSTDASATRSVSAISDSGIPNRRSVCCS